MIKLSNWFTIEKIEEDTFAISEYKHWEETHSYLLIGTDRALLIDTGMGIANIAEEVEKLTNKPITAIATHVHYDHVGGHKYFADNFYVHNNDLAWITGNFPLSNDQIKEFIAEPPNNLPEEFDLEHYQMFKGTPQKIVEDGDIIDLGNRRIRILHTPGHAPGHLCFFEEERQYLYTGDLIYIGELFMFYPSTDPLAYRDSIRRLMKINIKRIFPAHHDLNVPVSIISEIDNAFSELEQQGLLKHGSGIFDYGKFQLHL